MGTAAHSGRSPDVAAVPVPGTTLDFYACPCCRELDYRPLGEDRRRCLSCGQRYRDSGDAVETQPPRQRQVIACPACGDYAYSPGPAGLPQRRCHGCGEVWTP